MPRNISLSTRLDQELGFDSLTRVELILRIERHFAVSLPQHLLASAEQIADLLQALEQATPEKDAQASSPTLATAMRAGTVSEPREVETLPDLLAWHQARVPDRTHVILYDEQERAHEISYHDLGRNAQRIATALQQQGVVKGDRIALMLPTGSDYLYTFFAILLAGAVPVPLYPPVRLSQLEDHLRRHSAILESAGCTLLVTVAQAKGVSRLLQARVATLRRILTPEALAASAASFRPVPCDGGDTAFLQYTSGSTGQPKGVVLSHAHLLANIRAMGGAIDASANDLFVSWLPLYHDMGLIGAWLGSLYYALPLVLMSPLAFLSRPQRWLRMIERHRGTLSAAPNFAYELCLTKLRDEDLQGLDLSSWRLAFNGAEPVNPQTLANFSARFARYGFRPSALTPVYGLAEAAVGLAFPPLERGPLIDSIERESLLASGRAEPAPETDDNPLRLVACGQPLPGYQIRIVDGHGRELPERREGEVQFQGPSATSGYFGNPEATATLFADRWLKTGDRGYLVRGELYLTSRSKELIIRGGRNIYPYETEAAVGRIAGIRKGCVAMFGAADNASATERVILVAEARESDPRRRRELRDAVLACASELLGSPPDEVIIAAPHTILKTSSGKIRRSDLRQRYLEGALERPPGSLGRQLLRFGLGSLAPGWRQLRQSLSEHLYAGYVQALFWIFAPSVWTLVALMPTPQRRWRAMRGGARLFLRLAGIPLQVEGCAHIPDEPCVMVVNHSSYLDGIVLAAALPVSCAFIAKRELQENFIARLFLRRIGALLVERHDREGGIRDAKASENALRNRSLLYFPEGTFQRAPGMLPFRMGAFVAASNAAAPLLPMVLQGSRAILRDGSWFPRRGRLLLTITAPLRATDSSWKSAIELRDAARRAMLENSDEPDEARNGSNPWPVNEINL
ncbi:MAG: AMP-binding protein [Gammaproteobacteria bacterium]|nr:AMP-binding protein [Gammaproteobacteria bacterium]